MLYRADRIGQPCHPIVDLDTGSSFNSTVSYPTIASGSLNVHLDSNSLGSNREAHLNLNFLVNTVIPTGTTHSVGMLLQPLAGIADNLRNPMIEFWGAVSASDIINNTYYPFIGVLDKAQTPAAGYNATENAVALNRVNILPCFYFQGGSSWKHCIVLQDINSTFDNEDYICLGAMYKNGNTGSKTAYTPHFTMGARYHTVSGASIKERF